jgi:hypothetical protein
MDMEGFLLLLRLFNVAIAVIKAPTIGDTRAHPVTLRVSKPVAETLMTAPTKPSGKSATADASDTRA